MFLDVPKKATSFGATKATKRALDILGSKKDFLGGLTQSFEYVPLNYEAY